MRALVQRVAEATVTVDGDAVGEIGPGLLVFVGVTDTDDGEVAARLAAKAWNLRIFDDAEGLMNLSLAETSREALVVSQFTLYGDTRRGRRPSWVDAAPPEQAEPLVERFVEELASLGALVETGRFRAYMRVALTNDGPVTLLLEV